MASDVDICNLALSNLGDEASVVSISPPDQSAQAGYCARFYPIALATFLDEHAWGFNTKEALLTQITNPSALWAYAYALPSDFINVIAIFDSSAIGDVTGVNYGVSPYMAARQPDHGIQQAFSVEADYNGNSVLYTDQLNALLKYGAYVANAGQLPPLALDAIAAKLSVYLAGPILKGDVGAQAKLSMMKLYQTALKTAKESDAQNRKTFAAPIPSGIAARA